MKEMPTTPTAVVQVGTLRDLRACFVGGTCDIIGLSREFVLVPPIAPRNGMRPFCSRADLALPYIVAAQGTLRVLARRAPSLCREGWQWRWRMRKARVQVALVVIPKTVRILLRIAHAGVRVAYVGRML